MYSKDRLIEIFVEREAILTGRFDLTSGGNSKIYIDCRLVTTFPEALKIITTELSNRIKKLNIFSPDINIIAPAISGISIASSLSEKLDIPFIIDRGKIKKHGTEKRFEGKFTSNPNCIVVDDLITTGGTLIDTIQKLRGLRRIVKYVFIVVDREENAKTNLGEIGINCNFLITLKELILASKVEKLMEEKNARNK